MMYFFTKLVYNSFVKNGEPIMRKNKLPKMKKYNQYRSDLIRFYESSDLTMKTIYDTAKIVAEMNGVHVEHALDLHKNSEHNEFYYYGERLAVRYIISHNVSWYGHKDRYMLSRKRRYLSLPEEQRVERVKRAMKAYPWSSYVRTEIFKQLQKQS